MTLAELQPYVERAVTALEWSIARARWRRGLDEQFEAITNALPLAGSYGVEREPLEARLRQIGIERTQDVTADQVSEHPVRSVPMDVITVAVVRRILRIPVEFPVLSIKALPHLNEIADAVTALAARWSSPHGARPVDD